jgi:phosphatidylinositol kinase/protein kinase (PI-3  family)
LLVHKKNKNGQMNETFVKRIEKILAEQLPEEFINNEQIRDSFESAIQQAFDKHNLYL